MQPTTTAFYDANTSTVSYVVHDPATRDAVIIDPVLDYDPLASQTSTESVDAILRHVRSEGLRVRWLLETHAHADHLSAARLLAQHLDAPIAIGERITEVQRTFKPVFGLGDEFATDGRQFDRLLRDNEVLAAGSIAVEILATPGHTVACVSFKIGDAVFTGDALFMHDYGTGRCDFPGGDADALYSSIHERLYRLPDDTRVFVGHDYQPGGRATRWETTIGESKRRNVQLRADTARADFVALRRARDAGLASPRLLYPSVQININGGRLPPADPHGTRLLRLPINRRSPTDDFGNPAR